MSLYITQLHAGDWYICATTGSPRDQQDFAYRAPPFDTKAEAETFLAARSYRTELTPAGEQHVIPGCERNASPRAKQLDLF